MSCALVAVGCGGDPLVPTGESDSSTGSTSAPTSGQTSSSSASTINPSDPSGDSGADCGQDIEEVVCASIDGGSSSGGTTGGSSTTGIDTDGTSTGRSPAGSTDGGDSDTEAVIDCSDVVIQDSNGYCIYGMSEVYVDNGQCCAILSGTENCCDGRPFYVDDQVRTAPVTCRADWVRPLSPAVEALGGEAREALAEAWAADAAMEHASVASFARFVLQLMAVGAPADLVDAAQQAMRDEVEHARICFGLASAYLGASVGPGRLGVEGAMDGTSNLVAIAVATVREGCVGETIAALHAEVAAKQATDPVVRAALQQIAEDEGRHAELAWRFVAWAIETGGERVRRAVARALEGEPAQLDDVPPPLPADLWRAHGRLCPRERAALAGRACREIVGPLGRNLCQRRASLATEAFAPQ